MITATEILTPTRMTVLGITDTPMSTSRMQVRMSICLHATSGADPRAGKYSERDLPDYSARNFEERGFTVGIGVVRRDPLLPFPADQIDAR